MTELLDGSMNTIEYIQFIGSIMSILSLLIGLPVIIQVYREIKIKQRQSCLSHIAKSVPGSWNIVIPRYQKSLANIEDIVAGTHVRDALRFASIETRLLPISNQDKFQKDHLDIANNILICGPKLNKFSEFVSSSYSLKYNFIWSEEQNRFVLSYCGAPYSIEGPIGPHGEPTRDYALLGCVQSESGRLIIFVWGLRAMGTVGASAYLVSKEFDYERKHLKEKETKEFLLLIETRMDPNTKEHSFDIVMDRLFGPNIYYRKDQ